jgi:hypothetical protein
MPASRAVLAFDHTPAWGLGNEMAFSRRGFPGIVASPEQNRALWSRPRAPQRPSPVIGTFFAPWAILWVGRGRKLIERRVEPTASAS